MNIDDAALHSSLAHIVLCGVAGRSFSRLSNRSFVHPGMDANFFIHGVLGFLQSQSTQHWFRLWIMMYLVGQGKWTLLYRDVLGLRNVMITQTLLVQSLYPVSINMKFDTIISKLLNRVCEFCESSFGDFEGPYNISMAATKYLALPCLMADLYGYDQTLCAGHLLSGVVPFALHLAGQPITLEIANMLIGWNIVSLCYWSFKYKKEWGLFTAGGAVLAYFVTFQMKNNNITYPLALALMEACVYNLWVRAYSDDN